MQSDIDLFFIMISLSASIVTFVLALIIYKKERSNLLNQLFFGAFLSLSLGTLCMGLGEFLTDEFNLLLTKIAYTLIFLAATLILFSVLTLNYSEQFWTWPTKLIGAGLVLSPFTLLLLVPNSMYFSGSLSGDINMTDEVALIYFSLIALIGIITIFFLVSLYRQASGTIKKRFGFFFLGYIITLIGGAVPDLLAHLLLSRFFDILALILLAVGSFVIFIGFNIKEKGHQES